MKRRTYAQIEHIDRAGGAVRETRYWVGAGTCRNERTGGTSKCGAPSTSLILSQKVSARHQTRASTERTSAAPRGKEKDSKRCRRENKDDKHSFPRISSAHGPPAPGAQQCVRTLRPPTTPRSSRRADYTLIVNLCNTRFSAISL